MALPSLNARRPGKARTWVASWLAVFTLFGWVGAQTQTQWDVVHREDFGPDAHPLYVFGGVITFGPQVGDPWTALLRDGRLQISNGTDSSVIRYYFLEPRLVPGWEENDVTMLGSVHVGGTFGEFPGAGLVYGADPITHHFVALVLTGGDGYGVYVLDEQGYRAIASGTSSAIDPDGLTQLVIAPSGDGLGFYVGGERVFEGPLPRGVGIGLVAAGTGRFAYDDFVIAAPR